MEKQNSFYETFFTESWKVFHTSVQSNAVGTTINDWNEYFTNNKSAYDLFYLNFQSKSFALVSAYAGELALKTYSQFKIK